MTKRKSKARQRLAKLVMAALLCTSGVQIIAPAVAHADDVPTVTITGPTDPWTVEPNSGAITVSGSDVYPTSSTTTTLNIVSVIGNSNYFYGARPNNPAETSGHTVNVTGSAIYNLYGGQAEDASANSNTVRITEGSSVNRVAGGYAENDVPGDKTLSANGNTVTIKESSVDTVDGGYIYYAYYSSTVSTDNNTVTISDSIVDYDVTGGYIYNAYDTGDVSLNGNTVEISDSTIKEGDVTGGFIYNVDYTGNISADRNMVTINNSSVNQGDVTGGYIGYYYLYYTGDISASDNTVEISASTVDGNVTGGYIADEDVRETGNITADGNKVTVSGKSKVYGAVDGGHIEYAYYYTGDVSASGNTVEISDSTVDDSVRGGYIHYADETGNVSVDNNTVTISDSTVDGGVTGGYINYADYTGDVSASGNTVEISDSTVDGGVTGGYIYYAYYTGDVSSSGNTVTISGSTVNSNITGGRIEWFDSIGYNSTTDEYTGTVSANNNVVTISDSTVEGDVRGGYIYDGYYAGAVLVGNNAVTISNSSVSGNVYGGTNGFAEDVDNVSASDNTVTISNNSTIEGDIYGGFAKRYGGTAVANNNTVNILTPIVLGGLYGGVTFGDAPRGTGTGNTLNLAAKNVTAREVYGFQNMNFYLPSDIANNDTMLTVNGGAATDVTGVTFGVAALSGVKLEKGNTVNLITNPSGLTTDDTLKTTDSATLAKAEFLSANSLTTDNKYELSISKKGEDTIIATVDNVTEQKADEGGSGKKAVSIPDVLKSPVETRAGVVTMINAGADLLIGQGMSNAADAAAAERTEGDSAAAPRAGGFAPFAAVSFGKLRAESGSHVDTKGLGMNLGFAREIENKSGKLLVGPVIEYGHGSYDSYQDNGIKADGKSSYWGIGVIAKQTNDNGFYYEGSLRAGRTKSDYDTETIKFTLIEGLLN